MPLFDPRLAEDLRRYPKRPWFREQSAWAVLVYRFGRQNEFRRPGALRWLLDRLYWPIYRVVETLTGITLPKSVELGGGLRIHHFGCIVVHAKARIGQNCTLRQGVTIGNRYDDGPVPVIEDDVDFGAYAQVLGGVRVGRGAKIGAMSVVLTDVPPGATVVGVPARIIPAQSSDAAGGASSIPQAAAIEIPPG
jgi:serine O-acetyltransferase